MKDKKTVIYAAFFTCALVIFAMYSLGVIGRGYTQVDGLEYGLGGFTYSGGFRDGLFNDEGIIQFHDGGRFNGQFANGRFDGNGVFYYANGYANGWAFEGFFREGAISSGVFYLDDGAEVIFEPGALIFSIGAFTGEIINGRANGTGEFRDADGRLIYTGGFVNGLFDGYGVYYSPEGWVYEGYFSEGMFHGEGFITDDVIIRGVWENGVQVIRYE